MVCWMLPEQLALLLREHINSIFNVLEEYQVTQVILRETTTYSSHNPLVGGKHQLSICLNVDLFWKGWVAIEATGFHPEEE